MRLSRLLRSSIRPLFLHWIRTGLALSGVAVGVCAVVVSGAIGGGAREEMRRLIEGMGTNLLIVKPLPVKRLVARQAVSGLATTLIFEDYQAIVGLARVSDAAPGLEGNLTVKAGTIATKTTVRGTTPAFPSVRRLEVASGRFFDAEDNAAASRVAVLGTRVADALFEGRRAVGQAVRIQGVSFEVIGVLGAKGATADGADQDNQVLVPYRTAARRIFNATWLTTVYVSVREPDLMDDTAGELEGLLRERHRRGRDRVNDDFDVQNTAKIRSAQQQVTESLGLLGTGLALITLLVGGVGILALMFLLVRERTGEIGLRMAVGARPRDILAQFLVEATVMALAGWTVGIVLGGAVAVVLALTTKWILAVPYSALLASLGMTVLIGVGFGALPAWSAAHIPPIQALLRT